MTITADAVSALYRQLAEDLNRISLHTDDQLSAQGLADWQHAERTRIRESGRAELDRFQTRHRAEHDAATRSAEKVAPRVSPTSDAIALARYRWDQAKPALDRGTAIGDLLAGTTDPAMVIALAEQYPGWIETQTGRTLGEGDLAAFTAAVQAAWVRVAPDPAARIATQQGIDANRTAQQIAPWAQQVTALVTGEQTNGLGAALSSHYAGQPTAPAAAAAAGAA